MIELPEYATENAVPDGTRAIFYNNSLHGRYTVNIRNEENYLIDILGKYDTLGAALEGVQREYPNARLEDRSCQ